MLRDEIVEQVRAIREKLLRDANGDLDLLFRRLKEREVADLRPVLSSCHHAVPERPMARLPRPASGVEVGFIGARWRISCREAG